MIELFLLQSDLALDKLEYLTDLLALFKWIVGGMAAGMVGLAIFFKWFITRTVESQEKRFDQVMETANNWHDEAMVVLNAGNQRGIKEEATDKAWRKELRNHMKETKYSILNINNKLGIEDVKIDENED